MSGNGKQVQLAPGQTPRYACVARPHTPQRTDGFSVPSAGVGGSYVAGGAHMQGRGLSQPPTPPQQELKQQQQQAPAMSYGQAGGRPQFQYRGGAPQPQPPLPRPAHHRQQPWPAPGQAAQQMVFSVAPMYAHMPAHLPHSLPSGYSQQQAPRPPYFQQPGMLQQPHYFSSYSGQQGQQPYMFPPSGQALAHGGRAPAVAPPPQAPQHAAPHAMLRYPPIQHLQPAATEKKRRTHALAIVDPKSGKDVTNEILADDANDTADHSAPQTDENKEAVIKEFTKLVNDSVGKKDVADEIMSDDKIDVAFESHGQTRDNNFAQQPEEIILEPTEEKYTKLNQHPELSETPVVSAISNSPEIVPKQSHVVMKQKQIENVPDLKKSAMTKNIKHNKHLTDVIIDVGSLESKEAPCKDIQSVNKQVYKSEDILTTEDKPLDVPSTLENDVNVVQSITKPKLIYDNSHLSHQSMKDILLNPFNKSPPQPEHILPTQDTTAVSETVVKSKTELKKNKTRLNNSERSAAHPKAIEAELITDSKPLAPINNNSVAASERISPAKEICILKDVSPAIEEVTPEAFESFPELPIVSSKDKGEQIDIEIEAENIQISSSENTESIVASTIESSVEESIEEMTKEAGNEVSEPVQVEAPVEKPPCAEVAIVSAESNIEGPREEPSTKEESDMSTDPKEKGLEKSTVPTLRYNYKEDQWSPLNTSGKKCYDVDFLLMLRNDPNSKKKPDNINQQEIVADASRQNRNPSDIASRSVAMMRQNDLLPGFARSATHSATPNRKSQHGKPNPKGISTPGSGLQSRPIMHINLSLRSDVKLNETQNAWKPARMRNTTMEEEEIATEELYKTFRSVLNKLTPQKFDTLIAKVRKLNINTKERLVGVINLIFEKAIDEPNFSVAYALMCKELEQINVTDGKDDKPVNFRNLIVGKCQMEFEKDDNTIKIRKKEIDECADPEKKKELILNFEEEERKMRRRSVGNVRFIGELFKQNLIGSHIIVHCICQLLNKIEEETLECLCKLLTTIGKDLDKKNDVDMPAYFKSMKLIVENKENKAVSSRVRFMLQDVIDLRQNNWVPRQQAANANPKTMDQIKLEVEMEQKNAMYSNFSSTATSRKDDRPNNLNKRGGSKSVTEDGWSLTPTRNARKATTYVVDSGKLSKMTEVTPITQTSLQPSMQYIWDKGSTGTSKKTDQRISSHKSSSGTSNSNRKPATETSNTFLALDNQYPESSSNIQSDSTSSRKANYRKGASIERSIFKSENEDQSSSSSQESTSNKFKKMMTQGDSLYGILDKIQTNFTDDEMPEVVKQLILWGLEYDKCENIQLVGEVTGRLVDDENITKEDFLKAVKQTIIDYCSGYFTKGKDRRFIWKMFSTFIWAHMKKNPLTLREIHSAFSIVIELDKGFELLSAIFLEKLKESQNNVKSLWEKSNMQLSDWMSEESVDQFIEEFPLKWLKNRSTLNQETACATMLQMMQNGENRDSIKAWADQYVGSAVQEGWFIRAVTEAVHTYGLCPNGLDKPRFVLPETKDRLQKFYPLLITYIDAKVKNEAECFFALQHLISKLEHPQGLTLDLFESFVENCDTSLHGFCLWEKNSDPHEQEGKGVILKSLTSFITSMKSEELSEELSEDETGSVNENKY